MTGLRGFEVERVSDVSVAGPVANPAGGGFQKIERHDIEKIALRHDDSFPG